MVHYVTLLVNNVTLSYVHTRCFLSVVRHHGRSVLKGYWPSTLPQITNIMCTSSSLDIYRPTLPTLEAATLNVWIFVVRAESTAMNINKVIHNHTYAPDDPKHCLVALLLGESTTSINVSTLELILWKHTEINPSKIIATVENHLTVKSRALNHSCRCTADRIMFLDYKNDN